MALTGILLLRLLRLPAHLETCTAAQYLNPPLSPMLIIDREGNVHHLEYGKKDAETLRKIVEPYLAEMSINE